MHDPSKPLANARHERFACEWAKGKSQTEAAETAGYAVTRARQTGSQLVTNSDIRGRKEWLQAKAAGSAVLTVERKRAILLEIAESGDKNADRINAIKADNDLAPEVEKQGVEINIHIGASAE